MDKASSFPDEADSFEAAVELIVAEAALAGVPVVSGEIETVILGVPTWLVGSIAVKVLTEMPGVSSSIETVVVRNVRTVSPNASVKSAFELPCAGTLIPLMMLGTGASETDTEAGVAGPLGEEAEFGDGTTAVLVEETSVV